MLSIQRQSEQRQILPNTTRLSKSPPTQQPQCNDCPFSPPASAGSVVSHQPSSVQFEWDETAAEEDQSSVQDGILQSGQPSTKGYLGDASNITFLRTLMDSHQPAHQHSDSIRLVGLQNDSDSNNKNPLRASSYISGHLNI